ncbi:hypothetical protein QBC35DRAFT_69747 [Podospora australis]|uniref:BHLH domain-containing protein n=1 Tax=Podospora australis TaxID=1536484 RepID=A0AAN6WZG9_9PEZI|nr:hypothetical protein QBC35DRAFT_69747 [Podospora australis]
MPRGTLPPTPASSTDIKGKDGSKMSSLQMSFELPPPAITPAGGAGSKTTSSSTSNNASQTGFPVQASETVKSRRRQQAQPKDDTSAFVLPPPPTRSRKIIQMKPREEPAPDTTASSSGSKTATASAASKSSTTTTLAAAGTKRKQPSATSAAGRKIARKTAHSLIERRRRSKMNEEFAVLKSLIPACTGEMHKLAILQASIEYVRYLEDCVAQLKAQRGAEVEPMAFAPSIMQSPSLVTQEPGVTIADGSPDVDMTSSSSTVPSPAFTPVAGRSQHPSVSPALRPENAARNRHGSISSVSTDQRAHSYTSPAFGPQSYGYTQHVHSASSSMLTSPALIPQRDLDQEATAALLMLNQMDRRTSSSSNSTPTAGRGMSVKDLLST